MRSVRFGSCGLAAHIEVSDTDPPEYRIAAENCRDRWCRPCQRERGRVIAANIVEHLDARFCRFITLTIRTHEMTLQDSVIKLYNSFAKLRQTTFWRTRVTGGCVVCEIKRCRDDSRWHPHLHLLVEGTYVPQGWLSQKWHKITGDSYIVDVQACPNATDAARYITKYLSKPVPSSILRNHEHLIEAIRALTGRRLVATFGSWRGVKLTHTESQHAWSKYCTYMELIDQVHRNNPTARRILTHLLGQADLDPSDLDNWLRTSLTLYDDHQTQLTIDYDTVR